MNRDSGYATLLLDVAPGTRFPAHHHGGAEECYVVSGAVYTLRPTNGPGRFPARRRRHRPRGTVDGRGRPGAARRPARRLHARRCPFMMVYLGTNPSSLNSRFKFTPSFLVPAP